MSQDTRKNQLAKIHIAKKDLGLADENYREILSARFGADSARDLSAGQLDELVRYFKSLGWRPKRAGKNRKSAEARPRNMGSEGRGPLLEKIEAYLAAADRPWAYADGIARRVCKVDRAAWCTPQQLRKIVAALAYDAKRNQRRV